MEKAASSHGLHQTAHVSSHLCTLRRCFRGDARQNHCRGRVEKLERASYERSGSPSAGESQGRVFSELG